VIFCDLVDSTGIAAKLDAEEWRDSVGAYLDAASAAVTEMGGKVAKKLGDGLMALFGYPVAQENDAERAVRAALSIQRALAELKSKNAGSGKPVLVARIAIVSGPVVVDASGEIFGDVPNIAARAQALAEPGSVVVTARVQRQAACLVAAIVDGATRPPRLSARVSSDWRGDRARLFLPAHSSCGRNGGRCPANGARTARRGRHPAGAGSAARLRLSFQTRAHSGRGL
jgi:class 3 adenylate cyclase